MAIVGMTGIGKTALAERVVASLMETSERQTLPYLRFSLDDRSLTPDFSSSGAALLRTLGEEPTLDDQKDPANLLTHLLNRLCSNPCRVQIDSLEQLLRGNEQEGWSEFCDPLWLDLLQKFLAGTLCSSQLLLTSQDIPGDLDTIASRYPQFWHYEPLQGLSVEEQQDLFQKLGLNLTDSNSEILQRIGKYYDGHPLILQVIAEEIRQPPFQGDIARYWQHYEAEFTATAPATASKLERSRLFRRRVRQRVEQSIQRLPESARRMLCACSVFRRPVPIEFWHAMLPEEEAQTAFDTLQDRNLVEYAPATDNMLLVRQHNLIRSVASALLKADPAVWEAAERQSAHLWLTAYQPTPNAPDLETVRGYLEAFDHYCEVGDWDAAEKIAWTRMDTPTKDYLCLQLGTWGYFREQVLVHSKQLEIACKRNDRWSEGAALGNLGVAYDILGQYERTIDFCQRSLTIAREIGNHQGEGTALSTLGSAYDSLGKYKQAINFCQRSLTIAREIGNRRGEGVALSNLGGVYDSLGRYEWAIDCYQQHLAIAREIGDRQGEGIALSNLGGAFSKLGQYERASDFHQQNLTIAREIGDRRGKSAALGNLGITFSRLGQCERAIDFHQQALVIAQEIGDREGESAALGNLGITVSRLGQYERAIDFYQQQLVITREIGDRLGENIALVNLGETQYKLRQYSDSLGNNQAALGISREIGARDVEAEALKNLAAVNQALSELEVARQYAQQALALATELGIPLKAECESLLAELN